MPQQTLTENSPWMKALLSLSQDGGGDFNMVDDAQQRAAAAPAPASAPPAHRIEDDKTAGIRGTSPQPDQASQPSQGAIAGSIAAGQTTQLADRVQKPPSPLAQRIDENRAKLGSLGTDTTPKTLGDTVLPGGGFWRGLGRTAINAVGGGVGQTRRDEAFKNTLAQRTALSQSTEADTRQLSQEQESENRLREQEEFQRGLYKDFKVPIADANREAGIQKVGMQQSGATQRTGMQVDSRESIAGNALQNRMAEFKSTDEYRRWKEQLDADTRLRTAQMRIAATQNKAPAAMMQTATFANGGLSKLSDAAAAMKRLEQSGVMGQSWAQNKAEEWIFGHGATDPQLTPQQRYDIGQLRAALGYTSSAAMRAHTGRTSQEIYNDFKQRLGPGQDWDALRGAMDETHSMLYQYATSASDAAIGAIRSGTNVAPDQPQSQQPPRPANVPAGWTYNANGPKGKGWYAPKR